MTSKTLENKTLVNITGLTPQVGVFLHFTDCIGHFQARVDMQATIKARDQHVICENKNS